MAGSFENISTRQVEETAYLVGVSLPAGSVMRESEYLDELARLAETAGARVAGKTVQSRTRIDGATFIGPGKARAVKSECERLGANLVILDSDLSPAQARNLENILGLNVIDRTELILDIFARHAKTRQAKIQVELAQLAYMLPRLRKLWDHLSRQAGGIGTRGPGETQLEVDRRRINMRISWLKRQLRDIDRRKQVVRNSRKGIPAVAIVGYTNAGKSTLLNALTGSRALVRDQLFATLDTMTRRMKMRPPPRASRARGRAAGTDRNDNHAPGTDRNDGHVPEADSNRSRPPVLVIDTVGFIRKLPHHLVESFKATLEDIAQARLYLHVVDVSHPAFDEQMEVVDRTLRSIDGEGVETLYVFNKVDLVDEDFRRSIDRRYPGGVFVCAAKRRGINELRLQINRRLFGDPVHVQVRVPAVDGRSIALVRKAVKIAGERLDGGLCVVDGWVDDAGRRVLDEIKDRGLQIEYTKPKESSKK